ncbi:metallophosphoesterase [Sorangium cellulosum]|uniref:Metallophosphoesterase n=1 Tax=Sorangium cellulosum TaxID=56 RepID=A0A2L0FC08_SORCE|nr:metallophosphoesterase family protein [Sorangium cellulosum]AUX49138.1 metallophosphoesterase [Sorangium cellulosum]
MRTLVHLSDLHFGRVDKAILQPLIDRIKAIEPHVIVISGDLTQRARSAEFVEARKFLDELPSPQIVVPGNHDVPLYNLFDRFFRALDKYQKHITEDLSPFHVDEEIAVLGINTARSFTIKEGRINARQIAEIKARMCRLAPEVTKIVVTHHPFDLPENSPHGVVGRARQAMVAIANCGVDVILSGHLHLSHTGHSAERFDVGGHSSLIIQAGTATSTRGRGEQNAFNVIRIDGKMIRIERNFWQPEGSLFGIAGTEQFEETARGWVRAA